MKQGLADFDWSYRISKGVLIPTAVAIALGASACTTTANGSETASDSYISPAATTSNQEALVSPLLEYSAMIWGTFDVEEHTRQMIAESARREELIAQCMNEAGFEYIPNIEEVSFIAGNLYNPDNSEWVAQYGFGLTSSPYTVISTENPNDYIVNHLSTSERKAYQIALFGPPRTEIGFIGFDNMGCWGFAWETVSSDRSWGAESEEFAPLREAIELLNVQIAAMSSDADADWMNCMAGTGHPGFESPSEAAFSLADEFNAQFGTYPDPTLAPGFADFREREISVALASLECRVQTNYRARQNAIRWEAERQFVTDHRTALDALRSAYEQRN